MMRLAIEWEVVHQTVYNVDYLCDTALQSFQSSKRPTLPGLDIFWQHPDSHVDNEKLALMGS